MKTVLALVVLALTLLAGIGGLTQGFSDFSIRSIGRILLVVALYAALVLALYPKVRIHFVERPLLAWPMLCVVYATTSPLLNVLAGIKSWEEASVSMAGGRVMLFFVLGTIVGVIQWRKRRSTQAG